MTARTKTRLGAGLLLAGIAMMIFGFLRGEAANVFQKAAHVCLECIGIG